MIKWLIVVCFCVIYFAPLPAETSNSAKTDGNVEGINYDVSLTSSIDMYYTYCSSYFSKLDDFPYNKYGSCGYVALCMVFGYLDSYYNGDLIPDSFNTTVSFEYSLGFSSLQKTPGLVSVDYTNDSSLKNYYDSLTQNSLMKYFFGYAELMDLIIYDGTSFYDEYTSVSISNIESNQYNVLDTIMDERVELAYYFLMDTTLHPNVTFYGEDEPDYTNYTIDTWGESSRITSVNTNVWDKIATSLSRDPSSPWIISYEGHAGVAYYYDSDNELIYVHQGYHANETQPSVITISNTRTASIIENGMKISISCDHVCPKTYNVTGNSMYRYYCPMEDRYFY